MMIQSFHVLIILLPLLLLVPHSAAKLQNNKGATTASIKATADVIKVNVINKDNNSKQQGSNNNDKQATTDKNKNQPRIVGGTPVASGLYPSYAFTAGTELCGGTLIHEDIILTAAHCKDAWADGALIGGTTITGQESEFINVISSTPNPQYHVPDASTEAYDIMLIKLETPSSAPVQKLNFDPAVPADGELLTVIGYGNTQEGGSSSDVLLGVNVPTVGQTDCEAYWGPTIVKDVMLCAGGQGGIDSCQGDSGGPIMLAGVPVGVVSYSNGCGQPGIPAVYARISGMEDFIKQGICDLSGNPPACCSTNTCISSDPSATSAPSATGGAATPAPSALGGGTVNPTPSSSLLTTPAPSAGVLTSAPAVNTTPSTSAPAVNTTPSPSQAAGTVSTKPVQTPSPSASTTALKDTKQPASAVTKPIVTQQPTSALTKPLVTLQPIATPSATTLSPATAPAAPSPAVTPIPTSIVSDTPTSGSALTQAPTSEVADSNYICFCDNESYSSRSKRMMMMKSGKGSGKGSKLRRLKKSRRKKKKRRKSESSSKYSSVEDYNVYDPTTCYCRPAYTFTPPNNPTASIDADRLNLIQKIFGQNDYVAYSTNRPHRHRKKRMKPLRNNVFRRKKANSEGLPLLDLMNNSNENNNYQDETESDALANNLAKVWDQWRDKRQTRIGVLNGGIKKYYDAADETTGMRKRYYLKNFLWG